jgi:hypothetical protein
MTMKVAAIYARVSSEKQKDENTIASQTAALVEFAANNDFSVSEDRIIEDAGFSGATLVRPGLEKLRDLAAEGQIQAVLLISPAASSAEALFAKYLEHDNLPDAALGEIAVVCAGRSRTVYRRACCAGMRSPVIASVRLNASAPSCLQDHPRLPAVYRESPRDLCGRRPCLPQSRGSSR